MIVTWNVRGAAKRHFIRSITDLKRLHLISVMVLLEPRISGTTALKVADNLGFSNYFIVDAVGFSGGLWLLWNSADVNLQVAECSQYTITSLIKYEGAQWFFIAVYANPHASLRSDLWHYLDGALHSSTLSWLFVGDFNEVVSPSERWGESQSFNSTGMANWISHNALIDLGFLGSPYTWHRSPNSEDSLMERLDRALGNLQWRTSYPEAYVHHLTRIHSNYNPLLLSMHSNMNPRYLTKPFRYQVMWCSHDNFQDAVSSFWQAHNEPMNQKLEHFPKFLTRWNKQVFGHLFRRKAALLRRLEGIYRRIAMRPSQYLCTLEQTLLSEYYLIQEQEEHF